MDFAKVVVFGLLSLFLVNCAEKSPNAPQDEEIKEITELNTTIQNKGVLLSWQYGSSQQPDSFAITVTDLSNEKDTIKKTIMVPGSKNQYLYEHKKTGFFNFSVAASGKKGKQTKEVKAESYGIVTDLPIVRINTPDSVKVNSKNWIHKVRELDYATLSISNAGEHNVTNLKTDIKGRGNSTWSHHPKKPYSINLRKKHNLLGMPAHKKWAFLANHSDKSLIRNKFSYELGQNIFTDVRWTPKSKLVELVLNGEYLGVYQLIERIKVHEDRVNIDVENGDFLLEVDTRLSSEFNFISPKEVKFNFRFPKTMDSTTFDSLKSTVEHLESLLYAKNFTDPDSGYKPHFDINSFVDWYIICEFVKNNDATFYSSVYMYYRNNEEKMYMAPLWDFDISAGNINYNNNDLVEGLHVAKGRWISQMLKDPYFSNLVKQRWEENKNALWQAVQNLRQQGEDMALVANNNFTRWPILGVELWPNRIWPETYAEEVEELVQWLEARYHWLDGQF